MKKLKLSSPILLVAIAAIFFASCSHNSAKHIPKDAFAVLVIDGGDLTDLADPEFIKENPEFEDMMEEVESESEEAAELIEDIIDNPDASGILLTEKMYAFATIEDEKDFVLGVIIPIKRKKLEENLDMIGDEFNLPISTVMKSEGDIEYFAPEDGKILGWNDDVFMFVFQEDRDKDDMFELLDKYMNLDKKESILSDKDFKKFHKNCEAVNMWVSSNVIDLIGEDMKEIEEFEELTGIDLANNYGHMHLEIKKDEIIYTNKLRFNETIQDLDKEKILDNIDKLMDLFEDPISEGMDLFDKGSSWDDDKYDEWDDDYYDEWEDDWDEDYEEMTDEEWEELLNELEETETE